MLHLLNLLISPPFSSFYILALNKWTFWIQAPVCYIRGSQNHSIHLPLSFSKSSTGIHLFHSFLFPVSLMDSRHVLLCAWFMSRPPVITHVQQNIGDANSTSDICRRQQSLFQHKENAEVLLVVKKTAISYTRYTLATKLNSTRSTLFNVQQSWTLNVQLCWTFNNLTIYESCDDSITSDVISIKCQTNMLF